MHKSGLCFNNIISIIYYIYSIKCLIIYYNYFFNCVAKVSDQNSVSAGT